MSDPANKRLQAILREHPALLVSALYVAASIIGMFYARAATLLGTTGQFVFLYAADSGRVDIHPIESIHSISFQAD